MTATPLTRLPPGRPARVVSVGDDGGQLRVRLAALGLVTGARIELLQHRPATVVRLGATTLALEAELAARIEVDPESV